MDIIPAVKFRRLPHGEGLPLPRYASPGAAGIDICSADDLILGPSSRLLAATGFSIELPRGHEAQVRPRSGLSLKHGVTVLNSPGTIDSDYRGEVFAMLINHGLETVEIARGERIAQLVISFVPRFPIDEVDELTETERGESGFGSTGK